MKLKYKILIIITPLVFVLDQLTKLLAVRYLEFGSRYPVVEGFFDLVHFKNTGAAFGMFSQTAANFRVPFFYIIALIAVVLLSIFFRSLKENEKLVPVALSLVFGGIAGNVMDRIRLGSVVDFLSFHTGGRSLDLILFKRQIHILLEWPAFNIADSAITVAMFLLIWSAFTKHEA